MMSSHLSVGDAGLGSPRRHHAQKRRPATATVNRARVRGVVPGDRSATGSPAEAAADRASRRPNEVLVLTQFHGLPTHVLLVHVVVAAVPLAALLAVLHAIWPAARRRVGALTPVVALIALIAVPITTHAGEWLKAHLNAGGAVEQRIDHHAALGRTLLPLVAALFVVSVAVWWLGRRYDFGLIPDRTASASTGAGGAGGAGSSGSADRDADTWAGGGTATRTATRTSPMAVPTVRTTLPRWASLVIAAVTVIVALVVVIQLYRIGDAGSRAVWDGVVSNG
jgi:hypothetical protein